MATIPDEIQYTKATPSGRIGQVPYPMNVETGSEQVTQVIGQIGGQLVDKANQIAKEEMNVEFYEKKRQISELGYAAKNSITGDEEADTALWNKFQEDSQAIAQSARYGNVSKMLNQFMNDSLPDWQQGMTVASQGIRKKNTADAFAFERMKLLELGDSESADTLTENALTLGTINQAEHDEMLMTSKGDAYILTARRKLAEGKLDELAGQLKTKPEGTTVKQAEQIANVQDAYEMEVKRQEKIVEENVDKVQRNILLSMHENRNKPISERMAMGNEYLTQLASMDITGERYGTLVNKIEDWQEGKEEIIDNGYYGELLRRAMNNPQNLPERELWQAVANKQITVAQYEHIIKEKEDTASPLKTPRADMYYKMIGSLPLEPLELDRTLEQWRTFFINNPDATPQQANDWYESVVEPKTQNFMGKIWSWINSPVSIKELQGMGYTGSIKNMMEQYKADKKKSGQPDLSNMSEEELKRIIGE